MLAGTIGSTRHTVLVLRAVLALLVASACLPGMARAELSSGGLSELASKAAQEEETSSTATTPANGKQTTGTSSALPGSLVILGVGVAVALLGGIAFVIVRDARSAAPVAEGATAGGGSRNSESRHRKRRAKAKAAKQQRKRNR
jgi:hypothetical protein